jgi:hypothetical protein
MADRGLSGPFLEDLEGGILAPLLERVKADDTLHLAIRKDYVNIYYRGGNLLRVEATRGPRRTYRAFFDRKYLGAGPGTRPDPLEGCPPSLAQGADILAWLAVFPLLKQEMDFFLAAHPKLEREYQQLVARSNNRGHAVQSTDYFIADIEYAEGEDRFDMIAVSWESSAKSRKAAKAGIAFIEMKYGDKALGGTSGLRKHLEGMNRLARKEQGLARLRKETLTMLGQQHRLGLIRLPKPLLGFTDAPPEFILFLMDHDPDSTRLLDQLEAIGADPAAVMPDYDLKFCAGTFMGLGLFKENVYGLEAFRERMARQIHAGARPGRGLPAGATASVAEGTRD